MAMEPAAISASPAVTMMPACCTAPLNPAASANGTVSPSAMPMTTSRTIALAVKCRSTCGVCGIRSGPFLYGALDVRHQLRDVEWLHVHFENRNGQIALQFALRHCCGYDCPL